MAAPPGNNFNPHGRPRQIGTEISRLVEAAGHVECLLGEYGLRLDLDERRGLGESLDAKILLGEVLSAQRRLGAEAQTIMRLVEVAQAMAAQLDAAPVAGALKGRRRKRRHTPDPALTELASTLARLDRIVGTGDPQ